MKLLLKLGPIGLENQELVERTSSQGNKGNSGWLAEEDAVQDGPVTSFVAMRRCRGHSWARKKYRVRSQNARNNGGELCPVTQDDGMRTI